MKRTALKFPHERKRYMRAAAYRSDAPTKKVAGVTVPADLEGDDLLKFMKDNLKTLMAEKKLALKEGDALPAAVDMSKLFVVDKDGALQKAAAGYTPAEMQKEVIICAINTTNYLDSHLDVHIPGIWKKTLKDNSEGLHLQEHTMAFDHVISDNSKMYTQVMTWKELGFDYPGTTEVLIFATELTGRNEDMEEAYRKGWVKQHSVGMRYVTLKFCVNRPDDDYYKEEYSNWNTYIDKVVNREAAEEIGYFWAVIEAKIIEGSAVVKGSNSATPSLGFKSAEPPQSTPKNEPPTSTQVKDANARNWDKLSEHIAGII